MSQNKYENRNVTNRKSPSNEDKYIRAYKELNPESNRNDNYDISAVIAVNGERGHALLDQSINRSKDSDVHRGYEFISDNALRKQMNKK